MASTLPEASDCCDPCVGSSTVTLTFSTVGGWYVVDDIAELRGIAASSQNRFAIVGTGAGFIGVFIWDNDNADPDDAALTINPTGNAGNGRWVKQL